MDEERRLEGLEIGKPFEIATESCQREETIAHEQTSETKI